MIKAGKFIMHHPRFLLGKKIIRLTSDAASQMYLEYYYS